MKKILEKCEKTGESIYLLGASEENLKACVANIVRDFPKINIAGYHNGFFDLNNPKEILEEIRQKDILLEICPTSNVQTNVIKDIKYHPVRKLYDANILVSINTDNNTVSNVTLTTEYEKLAQKLNFTYKDFVKMNKDAIRHAFISEDEKEQLLQKYDEKLNQLS